MRGKGDGWKESGAIYRRNRGKEKNVRRLES